MLSLVRAVADLLRPRVLALSLLPLVLMLALGWMLAHWLGVPARAALANGLHAWLDGWAAGVGLSDWGAAAGVGLTGWLTSLSAALAGVILVAALVLLVLATGLLLISLSSMPAVLAWVAGRHFPQLQRRGSRAWVRPVLWGVGHSLAAVLLLVLSLPLWLVPPLMVLLPLAIWAWLTERVMAHDALQWHASAAERRQLMRTHRLPLLGMGLASAVLSAAPALAWASLLWFALGFVVLLPLAVWLYTVVFLWTALWFAHYGLMALARLRAQQARFDRLP